MVLVLSNCLLYPLHTAAYVLVTDYPAQFMGLP